MKRLVVILILLLTAVSVPAQAADLLDIGTSARSLGMGRAYVGITGAGECVFGNPAGLYGLKKPEIISMYTEFSGDVKYTLIGVAAPMPRGTLGFGYASNKVSEIFATTIDASSGRPVVLEPFNYGTDIFLVDYADRLDKYVTYGFRFKVIGKGGEIASSGSGKGMNLDLGLSCRINGDTKVGIVIENMIIGGPGALVWNNGSQEKMPFAVNIGGSYRAKKFNTTLYSDISFRNTDPIELRMGAEWNVWRSLDLRAGLEQLNLGPAEKYLNYSMGVGYRLDGLRIDYAYYADTLLAYNSRHYVSIAVSMPEIPARQATAKAAPEKAGLEEADYMRAIGLFAKNLDETFGPGAYINRAGFVIAMESSFYKEKPGADERAAYSFFDVPFGSPAAPYIALAKRNSHIAGYPDGTFRPDKIMTRAEFITIVESVFEKVIRGTKKENDRSPFVDVPAGHWAERCVVKATESGLISGYPGKKFKPGNNIIKEEAMSILKRLRTAGGIKNTE